MWPLLHRPSPVGALSEQYCKALPKPDVFHRRRQKMAPEAISPFLQPLPFSHRHLPKLPRRLPLPLITCRSGQSGPDGSGPASPTRGQVFIKRQGSVRAAKLLMKEFNKDQKRDRAAKDKASKVTSSAAPSCYGCGAPLQTSESDAPGYVDRDTFELKKKHHQLRTLICRRCQLLSHGHMITAVGGNGGYPGGKQFVTAEELREKLSYLRREKALIVKLVDIVDFNGSFLSRIRDLVGANPIILVVTKVDLLPKGTDFNCIGDWIVESTVKKKLNVTSVHLTSAKSLVGITGVVSEIQKEKKGRDVYILGSANVGKSAFISALLRLMAEKDPIAAAAQRYKPVESAVPGTTLGPIQIDAFFGGGRLYDTPGVHLYHRQAAVVHVKDLPALAPLSRLKGQKIALTTMGDQYSSMNGLSIFWGGLVRIDLLKVPPGTHLTFYGPKALQIHAVPSNKADKFYQTNLGGLLTPPTGMDGAKDWRGLDQERGLLIKYDELDRPACDVAISGLGWVAIEPKSCGNPESVLEEEEKEFHFSVRVPRPVEIFVRTPMPVGKTGAEWYQYRELTDKEAESRPKWNF